MTESTPIAAARGLCRHYGPVENRVVALNDISFQIPAEARVALVGRSGSGKTTLLNLLAGLDRPSSGELNVAGEDLARADRSTLAEFRLRRIGVIFQSFQLIQSRTALQNVELPLILAGTPRANRQTVARDALDRVGLSSRLDHLPGQLSGGEQQRVAIARAIVNRPRFLLADEPTGNLDSGTAARVMDLLLEIATEHHTALLLITHDRLLAEKYANHSMQLVDGSLNGQGEHHEPV